MDKLVEGSQVKYALSAEDADNINQQIAKYPDRQPAGMQAIAGQRVGATVVLSRGPNHSGEERLVLRLDPFTPGAKSYNVGLADLRFEDGAWQNAKAGE